MYREALRESFLISSIILKIAPLSRTRDKLECYRNLFGLGNLIASRVPYCNVARSDDIASVTITAYRFFNNYFVQFAVQLIATELHPY